MRRNDKTQVVCHVHTQQTQDVYFFPGVNYYLTSCLTVRMVSISQLFVNSLTALAKVSALIVVLSGTAKGWQVTAFRPA